MRPVSQIWRSRSAVELAARYAFAYEASEISSARAPGCSRRSATRHLLVEPLGKRVELDRQGDRLQRARRKHARHRRDDAGDLLVARGEVLRAVQVGQEERGRGAVARAREEVGIGAREAIRLPGAHQQPVLREHRVGAGRVAQRAHPRDALAQSLRRRGRIGCARSHAGRL